MSAHRPTLRLPSRQSGQAARTLLPTLAGVAAGIAAAALVNHAIARRSERAHPAGGAFVEVDGVRLHYLERGEGRPVVFLHGNGALAEDFALSGVLERVAKTHRVIAFDRPGFGYSGRPRRRIWSAAAQAALLAKACRALGIERPIVVGHSWGTLVATEFALDRSTATAGLVLLSGYYFPTWRTDVVLQSPPAVPILGDILRYTISPLLGWLTLGPAYRKLFSPAAVTPRFAEDFPIGLSLRPSQLRASAADSALMIPAAAALRHRYPELKMPVVIMAGEGDEIADFGRQSAHLHQEIPQSELIARDGGHMIHYLFPDDVAAAVERVEAALRE